MREKLYYERSGVRWEAWTYSEGYTVYVLYTHCVREIERYARKYNFQLVLVN